MLLSGFKFMQAYIPGFMTLTDRKVLA